MPLCFNKPGLIIPIPTDIAIFSIIDTDVGIINTEKIPNTDQKYRLI